MQRSVVRESLNACVVFYLTCPTGKLAVSFALKKYDGSTCDCFCTEYLLL